jgi:hypothetical protein
VSAVHDASARSSSATHLREQEEKEERKEEERACGGGGREGKKKAASALVAAIVTADRPQTPHWTVVWGHDIEFVSRSRRSVLVEASSFWEGFCGCAMVRDDNCQVHTTTLDPCQLA